jgi:hypothetical protein
VTDEHITKTLRAIPVGHGENAVLHIEARGGHGGIDSNTDVFGGEKTSESGSDLKHVVRFLLGTSEKGNIFPHACILPYLWGSQGKSIKNLVKGKIDI